MGIQGRDNVHGKGGVRFKAGYTTSKDKNMLRNAVTELIIHEHINVTFHVAKQLQPMADRMVTYAKKGDVAARRQAARFVRDVYTDKTEKQTALQKLFAVLGPRYKDRNGGYTRVLKIANRKGDNSPMAMIAFVLDEDKKPAKKA
jgi:large subunit ribosomal protein L17